MAIDIKVSKVHHITKNAVRPVIKDMAFEQLKKQAQVVFDRVNKRIRNLETNNKIVSPALQALEKKRGDAPRFGTSGSYNNMSSLKREYAQALAFDNMETSTVAGARAYTNNLKNQIPNYNQLSKDAINLIFNSLHALHERMPDALYGNLLKYTDYLDTIVETASENEYSEIGSTEGQVDRLVTDAIEKMTSQVTDKLNDAIDAFSGSFDRLY